MGNKPARASTHKEKKDEILVKVVPPVDPAYVYWLTRDLERIHRFEPKNPQPVAPPDHYIEFMRLHGWLDLNLDDPDLAHLFKRDRTFATLSMTRDQGYIFIRVLCQSLWQVVFERAMHLESDLQKAFEMLRQPEIPLSSATTGIAPLNDTIGYQGPAGIKFIDSAVQVHLRHPNILKATSINQKL